MLLNRLNDLEALYAQGQTCIIPQVKRETERGLEELNGHVTYFERMHSDKSSRRPKNQRERVWRDKKEEFDKSEYEVLEQIRGYAGRLYRFIQRTRDSPQREVFYEYRNRLHLAFLSMARDFSKDLDENSRRSKVWMKRQTGEGAELETDKHLAASAFALSYTDRCPVVVLTADKDLVKLVDRIAERSMRPSLRNMHNLPFIDTSIVTASFPNYFFSQNQEYEDVMLKTA